MNVVRIDDYRDADTIATLRDLLHRAENGKLRGIAFSIKVGANHHRLGMTGDYWTNPSDVLFCATRLSYKVNQLLSARNGEPETTTMPL